MKKIIFGVLVMVLICSYWLIQPIRTNFTMKLLAKQQMVSYLISDEGWETIDIDSLNGPIMVNDEMNSKNYIWYRKLSWGDTAKITITVYKSLSSFSIRDKFFNPKISLSKNWNYINAEPSENFSKYLNDLFPFQNIDKSKIKFEQKVKDTSYIYTLNIEKILFDLNKGYYNIGTDKRISLYESFATIVTNNDTLYTTDAKIKVLNSNELVLIPIVSK